MNRAGKSPRHIFRESSLCCMLLGCIGITLAVSAIGEEAGTMDLGGKWKFAPDPGDAGRGPTLAEPFIQGWANPAFDDSAWMAMTVPAEWPAEGIHYRGVAWYRHTFTVPEAWRGMDLLLTMPGLRGRDEAFFNGKSVGGAEDVPRSYKIGREAVRPGAANTFAIRVDSKGAPGGFAKTAGGRGDIVSLSVLKAVERSTAVVERHPVADSPYSLAAMDRREVIDSNSIFGVCGHMIHTDLFYGHFSEYWRQEHTLPWMIKGNVRWIREPIYQTMCHFVHLDKDNPAVKSNRAILEGYLAAYEKAGVNVVLCPLFSRHDDPTPHHGPLFREFFEYVADLAARYSCIKVVELHNEPNLRFFWDGTAAQYVASARIAAEIIRAKAPGAKIVTGSISNLWWDVGVGWLEEALRAGMLDFSDGVSVHPYRGRSAPENESRRGMMVPTEQSIIEWWQMIQKYNSGKRPLSLYFTEVGYSSGKGGLFGVDTVERQAEYLSRMYLIFLQAKLLGVPLEATFWYDLKCDGQKPDEVESNFGLIAYDAKTSRPGFRAHQLLASYFSDPAGLRIDEGVAVEFSDAGDAVKHYSWRKSSTGALIIPFWKMEGMHYEAGDLDTVMSVTLPVGFVPSSVIWYDYAQDAPLVNPFTVAGGVLKTPVVATSRAAWIEINP